MTLGRRRDAVTSAERRASDRIRRAGATTSALRSDETSSLFPATVVGCGLALGLGLSWLKGARPRTRPTVPTVPPASAFAGLGALLRAAQQLAPLMQARPGAPGTSTAPDENAKAHAPAASMPDSADDAADSGAAGPLFAAQAAQPATEETDRD